MPSRKVNAADSKAAPLKAHGVVSAMSANVTALGANAIERTEEARVANQAFGKAAYAEGYRAEWYGGKDDMDTVYKLADGSTITRAEYRKSLVVALALGLNLPKASVVLLAKGVVCAGNKERKAALKTEASLKKFNQLFYPAPKDATAAEKLKHQNLDGAIRYVLKHLTPSGARAVPAKSESKDKDGKDKKVTGLHFAAGMTPVQKVNKTVEWLAALLCEVEDKTEAMAELEEHIGHYELTLSSDEADEADES